MKELFIKQKNVGKNINNIIRIQGYTKVSFSKITGISKLDLDKLIKGEYKDINIFSKHINKIMRKTGVSLEEILAYNISENIRESCLDSFPKDYKLSPRAKQIFYMLDNIVDICELYY